MINLLQTLHEEISAILFFGGNLEMAEFEVARNRF